MCAHAHTQWLLFSRLVGHTYRQLLPQYCLHSYISLTSLSMHADCTTVSKLMGSHIRVKSHPCQHIDMTVRIKLCGCDCIYTPYTPSVFRAKWRFNIINVSGVVSQSRRSVCLVTFGCCWGWGVVFSEKAFQQCGRSTQWCEHSTEVSYLLFRTHVYIRLCMTAAMLHVCI